MRPARLWPLAIVAVLTLTVVTNAVLFYYAGSPDAAVVEPDYYRKAVEWDATLAQRAQDAALGWRIDARLGADAGEGIPLTVDLVDAAGAPILDATLTVEAIHNATGARRPRSSLSPGRDRGYRTLLPLDRRGLWELRFEVVRGGRRFTATLRREIPPS